MSEPERNRLILSIFDEGRTLANALVPGEDLVYSRGEGALMLAFSILAKRAIEDVYADCGDTDAGVLASSVGQTIAREVYAVLFDGQDVEYGVMSTVKQVRSDSQEKS